MAIKEFLPTPETVRKAYLEELQKRNPDAESFVAFAEKQLADFIRRYVDARFGSIFENTDHSFYDRVRNRIALDGDMRAEDEAVQLQYSVQLRTYSRFLDSKAFKSLFKRKINLEGNVERSSQPSAGGSAPIKPSKPKERVMTEGEKKHVEYEVAHRSQALRQACIDIYGYQCQCCGMIFSDMYGEELGGEFIEVHHLKMISTYDESKPDDYVENLVPLCSNCHSMIHHGPNGPLTLRQLREAYKGEKREIKKWKED